MWIRNGKGSRALVTLSMGVLWLFANGCAGGGDADRDAPDGIDDAALDAIRALPYAGSTPAVEGEASGVLVHDPERTCRGLRLVTLHRMCQTDLIDEVGEVVQTWSAPGGYQWERSVLLEDGGLLVLGADRGSPRRGRKGHVQAGMADDARFTMRFDEDGDIAWKKYAQVHHDIEVRPDGTLAVLAFERRVVPEFHAEIPVRDDLLLILDPDDGSVLETQGILEMVRRAPHRYPLKEVPPSGPKENEWIDLFHSNSIEWMAQESLFGTHPLYEPHHVLVSFRNQDCVAIFDLRDKVVLWSWGQGEIRGPHDAQLMPGGTILLFDNGLGLKRSRAVEIDPRTNEIVWQLTATPPESFYTRSRGSAQRLPNGNMLLTESKKGRAMEFAPSGDVVWEWLCPYLTPGGDRYSIVRVQWVGEG